MGRNKSGQRPSLQAMAAELPSNVDAFSSRRLRIPLLCEILGNWTDDDHGLTLEEIRSLMAEYFGDESKVPTKPTLIEDLKAIEAARLSSCEIKAPVKGSNSGYRRSRSELSSSQIRMLVHLAQTSKFITEEESRSVCEVLSRKCRTSDYPV